MRETDVWMRGWMPRCGGISTTKSCAHKQKIKWCWMNECEWIYEWMIECWWVWMSAGECGWVYLYLMHGNMNARDWCVDAWMKAKCIVPEFSNTKSCAHGERVWMWLNLFVYVYDEWEHECMRMIFECVDEWQTVKAQKTMKIQKIPPQLMWAQTHKRWMNIWKN